MTSTQPEQPERKLSRGKRAAGAVALTAVLGLTGWAVAAGSQLPAPEPTSRSVQAESPPSAPPGTSESASPESASPGSMGTSESASPESASPTFTEPGPTGPETMPAPTPSEPRAPATEALTPEDPAVPGPNASAPAPPDRASAAVAPPAASGRIINQPPPVAAAKGFEKAADVAKGVAAKVTVMKAVEGEARGIGEVGGSAVQFTLEVTNSTTEPISLADAVVNVEAGVDRFPAELLSGPGAARFPADVAPGQTVSGVFVFQIPLEQRQAVRVLFHYQAVSPVAAFEGSAPLQGEAP
ncbi:hypothetical protein [Arthrobacter sp. Br18]|uniref:hypothetical protein n=1 Tax=Arthrobacter sp. Br18 TaxID=1312954 RepID=UPI0004AE5ABB|nr:hypothetical protein [Arthrobacter sp. Br18]